MSAKFLWQNFFHAEGEENIFTILKRVPIFDGLSKHNLRAIERILHRRSYAPREPIFSEGDVGLGMFIIEKGEVSIVSGKHRQEVARLRDGEFFGEIALFSDKQRTASAIAMVETRVFGFFQPDLLGLLETNPSLGFSVILKLAQILAERLDRATVENNILIEQLDALTSSRS
jgi:CRP/FNR family transcriptional regulator, cyclic AMP receptor protein